ncbi:MAG: radical SAM protein [Candidatus Omnitrophica bacterium]|nr:radical SAM protein [Candidatus Omnitrophota bacterium]
MNIYILQKAYKLLKNRGVRLALLNVARSMGLRTLLVRMDITNFCNIACIMCPAATSVQNGTSKKIMSLEQFRKIASDIFERTRTLHLSCGYEPLLAKHFGQCLVTAKEYGVPFVSFATNGMLLSEDICRTAINARIDEVIVSADGANKKTFEMIRKGANFDLLIKNLDLLKKMKNVSKSKLPTLRMNYTVMDMNISEIPDFIEISALLGTQILELRPVKTEARVRSTDNLLTAKGADLYNRTIGKIRRLCSSKGIHLLALSKIGHEGDAIIYDGRRRTDKMSGSIPCILSSTAFMISASGDLTLCFSGKYVGNILEKSYNEIMKTDAAREFLNAISRSNEWCDSCPLKEELIA